MAPAHRAGGVRQPGGVLLSTPTVTVVGGKGGVGKTSVASALAIASADAGRRTLVMSTDPAHSLGDVLDLPLGDRPREVVDGLFAVEPDADRTAATRVASIAEDAAGVLPREIMPAVRRHLRLAADGPGTREAALADRLVSVLSELGDPWEHIVVDSAPTGHLLQLVRAPSAMADWVAGLADRRARARPSDPTAHVVDRDTPPDLLLARLRERQRRMTDAAARLREDACVRLVCTPRRVVVTETERAAASLRDAGMQLGPVVVNHPGGPPDRESEERLRRSFGALVSLPTAEHEPIGVDALRTWWSTATSTGGRP